MSEQLYKNPRLADAGSPQTIRQDDIMDEQLRSDNEITIWAQKVPADAVFAHGAGTDNRDRGRDSFCHAELVASGNGDGTAGDAIEGDLVLAITDSRQQDVIRRYNFKDLSSLADAAADDRTSRPMQPVMGPTAGEDRHLELRVKATSGSDGVEIDSSSSDVKLYYTDIDA